MGKGEASSCFKLMTCGRDPEVNAGVDDSEGKTVQNRRKWNFRRKSSKNQVLNNMSISEPLFIDSNNKASTDIGNQYFKEPINTLQASEKIPTSKLVEEKPPVSSVIFDSDTTLPGNDIKEEVDKCYQESSMVLIQSAVRGYLARKEYTKLRNVVKLQAVIRGYLVRKQAVCTLRCLLAITKLQAFALARARKHAKNLRHTEAVENNDHKLKKIQYLTEKLQSNPFSRQLLVLTPTKRFIYISYVPPESASMCKWLERWMTLTSSNVRPQHEQNEDSKYNVEKESEPAYSKAAVESVDFSFAPNTAPNIWESVPSVELLNGYSNTTPQGTTSVPVKKIHEHTERELSEPIFNTSSDSNLEPDVHSEKRVTDIEKSKHTMKGMLTEATETDGKKSALVPKRSCNPAFAAAQSKFEELSAAPTSGKSISGRAGSFLQVGGTETRSDTVLNPVAKADGLSDQVERSDELLHEVSLTKSGTNFGEACLSHQMQFQTANSECGTEISISSTLDSLDRSDGDAGEIVLEIGTLERKHFDAKGNSNNICILDQTYPSASVSSASLGSLQGVLKVSTNDNDPHDAENLKFEQGSMSSASVGFQVQKMEEADETFGVSAPIQDLTWVKPMLVEHPNPDMLIDHESIEQGELPSPLELTSPRSHITAPESHGTPMSQISRSVKGVKQNANLPSKKLRSHVAGKRSLSTMNDSGAMDSMEHLQKDSKNGKKRNSPRVIKLEFVDDEPRNSSSNPLPNYMQATESAKAKLQASNSPKSSPDVHEKEIYVKKRHSLPVGNGKQASSPRMQRSASQVHQSSKGNNKRSPND